MVLLSKEKGKLYEEREKWCFIPRRKENYKRGEKSGASSQEERKTIRGERKVLLHPKKKGRL